MIKSKEYLNFIVLKLVEEDPDLEIILSNEYIRMSLEFFSSTFDTGDIEEDKRLIFQIVIGYIALVYYIATENEEIRVLADAYIDPIRDHLISILDGDGYRKYIIGHVVTGTTTFKPNDNTTCYFTIDELMLHFKRINSVPTCTVDVKMAIPALKAYWREIFNLEFGSTQMKGLACLPQYQNKLSSIADRLIAEKLINKNDKNVFISLFSEPTGQVIWNSEIFGSKAALFDLMERMTGKVQSVIELKTHFNTETKISLKWRDKGGKNTRMVDKILKDI